MKNILESQPSLPRNEQIRFALEVFLETAKGMELEPIVNVNITIQNDPSLLFANSTIAKFKQDIIENKLPDKGFAILQKCLRTWGLSEYLEKETDFDYNSYFTMIGFLFPGKDHREILLQTLQYLEKIGFDKKRIYIKTSKSSNNVNECLTSYENNHILFDTESPSFYNWVYGSDKIKGEGVTLSYMNDDGSINDLGNIISVLDINGNVIAWESGFGVETIIGTRDNKNLFSCYNIWDVMEYQDNKNIRKIADCIISTIAIMRENIIPGPKKQGYILKKYLTAIYYLNKEASLSIKDIIINYCNTFKIPNGIEMADKYESYMNQIHESKIKNYSNFKRYLNKRKNKNLSKEELVKIAKESFSLELSDITDLI